MSERKSPSPKRRKPAVRWAMPPNISRLIQSENRNISTRLPTPRAPRTRARVRSASAAAENAVVGVAGDEAGGECHPAGVKLLDRLLERGEQGRVQRTAPIGELAQEFILQLYRPGQLLGIARKDSVLKSALDPLELSR